MKIYWIIVMNCLVSSVVQCEELSLIGSYFMPFESNYEVFLAGINLNQNSAVNISLKSEGYEDSIIRNYRDSLDEPIKFILPNNHLSSYELKLKYYEDINDEYSCKQKSVKLINMAKRPIILIQLDKPVYNLGDVMKFRVFVFTQKLTPFDYINDMNILIYDDANNIKEEFNQLKTSEFGVYGNSYKFPEKSNPGKWKIEVDINGRKISKTFNIEKLDKNSLQANLITDDKVDINDKKMHFGINVKHPIDKFFFGTAKISFSRGNMKNVKKRVIKTLNISKQYTRFEFDIEDDLGITLIRSDMNLNFDIEIIDYTGNFKTLISKSVILKNSNHKITTNEKNYFISGVEFPVKIEVRKHNGDLDNSHESLQVMVEYQNDDETKEDEYQVDLNRGQKTINLMPTKDTKQIKLKLVFGEVELEKIFRSSTQLGINHYVQASYVDQKKDYKIDETATISTKISEEIESLNLLVFGPNGIVHSEIIKQDQFTDEFSFKIKITELMVPESNILVYYVRGDGSVVYDDLRLNVGFQSNNQVKLSMPEYANGNSPISINVKTEAKSMVFLTATDSMQEQSNEISRKIIQDIFSTKSSIESSSLGIYGAFIIKPSEISQCNDQSNQLDSKFADELDNLLSDTEILATKFIPSIWFDDEHIISKPEKDLEIMPLSSPGVWRVHGFAVHPTKGLSFADTQPTIIISKNSSLSITGPPSVKENESFFIECNIINLSENDRDISIKIIIENGEILEEFTKKVSRNPKESTKLLKFKGVRKIVSNFLIRAKSKGVLNVKVLVEDEKSELNVNVKGVKVPFKQISNMEMIATSENGKKEKIVIINTGSKSGYIKRNYDNLLGAAVEGLDKIFNPQYSLTEFKVDIIATWILSCRLQNTGICKNKLEESYKAVESKIKSLLTNKHPSNIRLVAYTSEILTEALEFIEVDQELIFNCLDFVKNHQKPDGSYPYDDNLNPRRGMGASTIQTIILVSKVLQAFKDNELKSHYKEEVKKSIKFLNQSKKTLRNDYEKILVAYTLALHDDLESAKDLVYKINCNFLRSTTYLKHKSMFVEIASYTILTKILLNADVQNEVRWLMSQRNADGGFYSPHDTVLGLRAIYEFSKYAKESGLIANDGKTTCNVLNIPQINSDYDEPQANATVRYDFAYSIVYQELDMKGDSKFFKTCVEMKEISERNAKIIINIEFNPSEQIPITNLVVAELSLPTGYQIVQKDILKNYNLESQNDGNLVVLYINKLDKGQKISLEIDAAKHYDISIYSDSYIKVYDYYQPNLKEVGYFTKNSKCSKPVNARGRLGQQT